MGGRKDTLLKDLANKVEKKITVSLKIKNYA